MHLASEAARREPDAPETVGLLARAEDFDAMLRVLRRIVVTAPPQRIADAFVAVGDAVLRFRGDDEAARQRQETLRQIVNDARKRLAELSPEQAAHAERLLIRADQEVSPDRHNWIHMLEQFVKTFSGTEAALLARVEILSDGRATEAKFEALDAFARQHAGTTAAARALYQIAFDLHTINTLVPRATDPIHRFERVMAIARELESGRYPRSEWVEKAPSLVFQFFIPRDAAFAPKSVDRMIAMLTEYAKSPPHARRTRGLGSAAAPFNAGPGIEQDVAAIRRAVFLPRGGGVYRNGRWGPPWPTPPSPFCLVNTDVPVKDHDGKVTRVSLVLDFDVAQRVLFFSTDQIEVFKAILKQLGGTRRRGPGHIMETPNQPVGDSMQILKLWTRFFVARPGHWGGWDLETAPVITEVQFTNAERTKASARVTIGYTGGTVELDKEDGRWIAKRLTSQWIT